MRFVVVGAGAIGGTLAARLHEAGREVVAVARGDHLDAIRREGLTVASPAGRRTVDVEAVPSIADARVGRDDVVLIATKSQATPAVLDELVAAVDRVPPIVCLQNGVANERAALRWSDEVLGAQVFVPAAHLEPGVVIEYAVGVAGVLDVGRWPTGRSDVAEAVTTAFRDAGYAAEVHDDIAAWKYTKLLLNLSNIVGALCGPEHSYAEPTLLAQEEARACYAAAGIAAVEGDEFGARTVVFGIADVDGEPWAGNSTWQSLARRTGNLETDFLNGEIALLGRLHDVPTPVNRALQRIARDAVARGLQPGTVTPEELMAMVTALTRPDVAGRVG